MPLITVSDIRDIKPLPANPQADARYNSLIFDSEFKELRPVLGSRFYQDLIRNIAETNYVSLMDGGEYTYQNFIYTSPGLRRVCVEYAYAYILFFGSDVVTPFGLVNKVYRDGENVDRGRAKEIYTQSKQLAWEMWTEVKDFLNRNYQDYPEWEYCQSGRSTSFKIKHITKI